MSDSKSAPKKPKAPICVVEKQGAIGILTLQKEPVNSMNMSFWKALKVEIDKLNNDDTCRCIIFQSGLKKQVFTAGLDIKELYAPATNEQRLKTFWRQLSETLIAVYSSKKITIAAIAGACPAGGCGLSLCCDYRVITNDGTMGLNEVALGIPVPYYWIGLMAGVIGKRNTEKVLLTGEMIPLKSLIEMNMVDKVVDKREELLPVALDVAKKMYLKHPDGGRIATKWGLRHELSEAWTKGIDQEAQQVWDCISDPKTVESLTAVLQRLMGGGGGGKKGKKPEAKL